MCGRYLVEIDDDELGEIVAAAQAGAPAGFGPQGFCGGEVFPGGIAPVIAQGLKARFMLWGFPCAIPGRRPHINARSETAATAKTFSTAMAARRCVVPASGYYEWKALDKKRKEKYLLTLPGKSPMYIAGIYSEDGRFAVLTRDAAPGISEIHGRMPVIIPKTLVGAWLEESPGAMAEALTDLRFAPAG